MADFFNLSVNCTTVTRLPAQAKSRRQQESQARTMQCQRCMEVGHWTYECKKPAGAVYVKRESRSANLAAGVTPTLSAELPPDELEKRLARASEQVSLPVAKNKRKRSDSTSSSSSDSSSDSSSSSSSSSSDSSSSSSGSSSSR